MNKISVKFIAESAIIAALYVAVTWALAPISYGPIQFRLSEALMLLVLLNPKYGFSLAIGCFIANTTSPLGWYDMVFGTLATILALAAMVKIKNIYLGALMPVVSNAIIISIELGLAFEMFAPEAFFYNVFTIALGEAVVLYLVGIPAIMTLAKDSYMVELTSLNVDNIKTNNYFTKSRVLAIALAAVGVIFYVAYPAVVDEEANLSFLKLTSGNWYLVLICILPILYLISCLIINKSFKHIISIILGALLLVPYILLFFNDSGYEISIYYYFYPIYVILLIASSVIEYKKQKAL